MARAVGVQVFTSLPGLDALVKVSTQRQVTKKAVAAGARVVARAAKPLAPKRKGSGALRVSIGTKADKGKKGRTLAFAVIGARAKLIRTFRGKTIRPAKYAHLVEKGTRAHFVGKRRHPGARAKPFLKPALDGQSGTVTQVMLATLAAEIAKAFAKQSATTLKTFKG